MYYQTRAALAVLLALPAYSQVNASAFDVNISANLVTACSDPAGRLNRISSVTEAYDAIQYLNDLQLNGPLPPARRSVQPAASVDAAESPTLAALADELQAAIDGASRARTEAAVKENALQALTATPDKTTVNALKSAEADAQAAEQRAAAAEVKVTEANATLQALARQHAIKRGQADVSLSQLNSTMPALIGDAVAAATRFMDALNANPAILDQISPASRGTLIDCGQRLYKQINEFADRRGALTAQTKADLDNLRRANHRAYIPFAQRVTLGTSQISFFAGPNFSLQNDGGWEAGGGEVQIRVDTRAGTLLNNKGSLFFDMSYQKVGEHKDFEERNPFLSDEGFLRLNVGATLGAARHAAWLVTAGLSSVKTAKDDKDTTSPTEVQPRGFIGGNFRTFVSDKTYAQFVVGYAYDEFWEYIDDPVASGSNLEDAYDRFIFDVTLMFPDIQLTSLGNPALKLFVDTPLDGQGPSDIRVSVLFQFDPADFFKAIKAVVPAGPAKAAST